VLEQEVLGRNPANTFVMRISSDTPVLDKVAKGSESDFRLICLGTTPGRVEAEK
jgi:hypothetical protein